MATRGEQDEVVAFFRKQAELHGSSQAAVIETHGAFVFFLGEDVYKIKRAIRFPYMDFSTLELRRRACLRELEVNTANAPDIYLSVVPITRSDDDQLQIDGAGHPVEYAVHMRRFASDALLSAIASARGIDAVLARDIADAVIDSHRRAPVRTGTNAAAQYANLISQIAAGMAEHPDMLDSALRQKFEQSGRIQLERCRAVLETRAAAGFVRRCHGDLHLSNMLLWQGKPTLFDALEFDEALATIDTMYDLAFLLMDLDRKGHRRGANVVLNRYLWRSHDVRDLQALTAMPLFLALRAGIRAMVQAQRATLVLDASARAAGVATARGYLDAALAYLEPAPPRMVAVGGYSGTGKSTLAAALAPLLGRAPGAAHLRSDLERKALAGVGETDRLPAASYTPEASARVYAGVERRAEAALRAGQAVIVDAAFLKTEERQAIADLAHNLGVRFDGLWLTAPAGILTSRVDARSGDASDATADVVRWQIAQEAGPGDWTRIDASGSPAETQAIARGWLGLEAP